jgi:hypothetical protein
MNSFLNSKNSRFDGALRATNEKNKNITASFPISPVKLAARGVLAVMFLFFSLVGFAHAAETRSPGWEVTTVPEPTIFWQGGTGFIRTDVYDTGAQASAAGATLTDVLPPGITSEGKNQTGLKEWECSTGAPVVCTTSVPSIAAGTADIDPFVLAVSVKGTAASGEVNRVTVAGGGAPAAASASGPISVSPTETAAGFGISDWDGWFTGADGLPDTRAGSHPYEAVFVIKFNTLLEKTGDVEKAGGEVRDIEVGLPPGMVANPDATRSLCTREEFDSAGVPECPVASEIGTVKVKLQTTEFPLHVYNMVPPAGVPAQFGFALENVNTFIDGSVRTGGDDGLVGHTDDIVQRHVEDIVVTLWGVPADPSHDPQRCFQNPENLKEECGLKSEALPEPFLTMPTSCPVKENPVTHQSEPEPLQVTLHTTDWPEQGAAVAEANASFETHDPNGPASTVGVEGCEGLAFPPSLSAAPETTLADTPSGLTAEVKVPQEGLLTPAGRSAADIENTVVKLPAGIAINPGQAAGLQSCSQAQSAVGTEAAPSCPNASKVGEVRIKTPLLEEAPEKELSGDVYVLQSNPPNLQLLVAASADGVNIKLVGDVSLCENTGEVLDGKTCEAPGQIVTKFAGTPQLPFSDFKLSFSGGAQAALATPTQCGRYETTADFNPWAGPFIPDAFPPASTFAIAGGPGGGSCSPNPLPFNPELIAGSTTDQAGAFTSATLRLTRGDGQQRIDKLQFTGPPGLSAVIGGVPLCTNAQAEADACPEASKVAETVVASGPGPYPLIVPEPGQPPAPIYLTESYDGAPFGFLVKLPLKVGPFELQTQVVRGRIEVNPTTTQFTVTSNPLPQVVDGIPTDVRFVYVTIDRPDFVINPTNCDPQLLTGTAYGTQPPGAPGFTGQPDISASISSHFGVGACRSLEFTPKLTVSTQAKTSKADGASLTYKVAYPNVPQGTESDIRYVKVELPGELPSRLTTLQKACTAKQFDANPAGCPTPSVIGHAVVHTQLLPVPLEGPVYFVSNGGEAFPNLEMVLQGDGVTVDLIGDTLIKNGVTSTTFKTVPDQPFQTFEINLPEGPYSALAANGNLCKPTVTKTVKKKVRVKTHGKTETITRKLREQVATTLTIPSEYIGQNGAPYDAKVPIKVTGCPKAHKASKKQKKAAKKRKKQ